MNIILFGFKGCGKTTLGKKLAELLQRPFLDTDRLLEALYLKQTGQSLPFRAIYKTFGEEVFRSLESGVLKELAHVENTFIATGGGFVLNPENAASLAKLGALVYLKISKETLKKWILSRDLPAFFDPEDPEGSFEKMYQERYATYEAIPAHTIDLENKTQDQVLQEICALIQKLEHPHG